MEGVPSLVHGVLGKLGMRTLVGAALRGSGASTHVPNPAIRLPPTSTCVLGLSMPCVCVGFAMFLVVLFAFVMLRHGPTYFAWGAAELPRN